MKKARMILGLLLALLVLGTIVPAVGFAQDAQTGDGTGNISPDDPPDVTDPTEPPPDDPTPPPEDPTPPPTDDPTPPPTDEPTPPPTDEPTSDPTTEPTDEPTAEPTDEPTVEPTQEPTYSGSAEEPTSSSPPRVTRGSGGGIRQPNLSSGGPTISTPTSRSSGNETPENAEPRYITFARVTQKTNSMSRVLFYSGAACVGTGVMGLVVLVIFVVRGRRGDKQEEIFAEIEQARAAQAQAQAASRVRQKAPPQEYAEYAQEDPYAQYDAGGKEEYEGGYEEPYQQSPQQARYAQGYDAPAPSLHRPEPEDLAVPVNGSMYTEEFELPPPEINYTGREPVMPLSGGYEEEFQPPRSVPPTRGAIRPTQAAMYTEEFTLPDELAQSPAPAPRHAQPPVRPTPRPSSLVPDDQMNTSELLREILYGEDSQRK